MIFFPRARPESPAHCELIFLKNEILCTIVLDSAGYVAGGGTDISVISLDILSASYRERGARGEEERWWLAQRGC